MTNGFIYKTSDSEDYEKFVEILNVTGRMAVIFLLENCIVTTFSNLKNKEIIERLLVDKFSEKSNYIGIIHHIKEEFQIKDTEIKVMSRTGLKANSMELESFWKFFVNNEYIRKSLLQYHSFEMCD